MHQVFRTAPANRSTQSRRLSSPLKHRPPLLEPFPSGSLDGPLIPSRIAGRSEWHYPLAHPLIDFQGEASLCRAGTQHIMNKHERSSSTLTPTTKSSKIKINDLLLHKWLNLSWICNVIWRLSKDILLLVISALTEIQLHFLQILCNSCYQSSEESNKTPHAPPTVRFSDFPGNPHTHLGLAGTWKRIKTALHIP